jgi:ribosomal protein S18 acetylase RimI-like enzyme
MSAVLKRKPGFALRTYNPGDFEDLFEIDRVCYEPAIAYSREELREYLQFPGAECVLAEIKPLRDSLSHFDPPASRQAATPPEIVGFCISAHRKSRGYIITIDVIEKYRSQGVGSALLTEIERRLASHGVRQVELETATDNESAIAFWQKHGYRKSRVRKGYYPGNRDAFSMVKALETQA